MPGRVIMEIAGWKTRSVFDRYNIVSEKNLKDSANRIKNLLLKAPNQQVLIFKVPGRGIEPRTRGFSVLCSTD
jgi:hypothetical protein